MLKGLKKLFLISAAMSLVGCAGSPPKIDIPAKAPPPAPLKRRPIRVALVLGAGGARGYAHLGVLQVLQWTGVPIDMVVGASAGSYAGALFADNADAIKTYHIMMNAGFWDMADIGLPNLKGLMTGYRLEKHMLANMQARTFRQLKINYIASTTNLLNGSSYFIKSGPVVPAVVASAGVPGVVRPQHLYGKVLVDGGVADPVPVNAALPYHPKVIIAVNIAEQLRHYIPDNAYDIYERAYNIMWERLTDDSLKGASIVIRPEVGRVGTFDMTARYQMYQAGYRAALKALPQIKRLLRRKHIALIPKSQRKVQH